MTLGADAAISLLSYPTIKTVDWPKILNLGTRNVTNQSTNMIIVKMSAVTARHFRNFLVTECHPL